MTDDPQRHGTFNDVHERLPMIRDMGFDVLYFPPIHPIGMQHRKGRNNASRPSRATRAALCHRQPGRRPRGHSPATGQPR